MSLPWRQLQKGHLSIESPLPLPSHLPSPVLMPPRNRLSTVSAGAPWRGHQRSPLWWAFVLASEQCPRENRSDCPCRRTQALLWRLRGEGLLCAQMGLVWSRVEWDPHF